MKLPQACRFTTSQPDQPPKPHPVFRKHCKKCIRANTETAAATYGLDVRAILVELGRRRMVGGREEMIVDVALDMLKQKEEVSA